MAKETDQVTQDRLTRRDAMRFAFQTCSACSGGEVATDSVGLACARLTESWKRAHSDAADPTCDLPATMRQIESAKPGTEAPELDGLTEVWIRGHVLPLAKG